MEATFVIVGGGIAGVSCAETLAFLQPDESIILVTESPVVKAAVNLKMLTKTISSFDVVEKELDTIEGAHSRLHVLQDNLVAIESELHIIHTHQHHIKYKYLCLCIGAKPKIIPQGENCPLVFGIRDTDSVETLIDRVKKARRLAIVGNGGIATELAYKVQNIDVDWIIKDAHTTATFLDPGAADFFRSSLNLAPDQVRSTMQTRMRFQQGDQSGSGAALGPDWYTHLEISGANTSSKSMRVHSACEVARIEHLSTECDYPVQLHLTNGETVPCDLVVSATGVSPRPTLCKDASLALASDGGILVDDTMRTSVPEVFAAGDVCTPNWPLARHWFPMKLWSQARQMGCYAAKCMTASLCAEPILQDFCFELFSHSTTLFGYKVVLLGLYNGQKLGTDYECLIRMTPGVEFIKFVLHENRLQGAILIGNIDLAETCENLILNQLDLSPYGDDILNPGIDIEDYFD